MKYPVILHHEEGTVYGVTIPDIPGCFSSGDTFDQAIDNASEAVQGHLSILAEDDLDIPKATPIENHLNSGKYDKGVWGFIDVDIPPFLGNTEKINVSLPTSLISRIDAKYKNRSKFLAEAALKELA